MTLPDHTHPRSGARASLLIDCSTCLVRGRACGDCVVTSLLGGPPDGVELEAVEVGALDVLAGSGLVPPLRLVTPVETVDPDTGGGA